MFADEDIAFQREILASSSDTTLKLVYADWLQDRADPRAEYVRRQVQLGGMLDPVSGSQAADVFGTLGPGLDPAWVAFMTTLAQPFQPIPFEGAAGHPFTEPIGHRGRVVVFESQFRTATDWSEGLLTDLVFLTKIHWGENTADTPEGYEAVSFLCEFPAGNELQNWNDFRAALRLARPTTHGSWPEETVFPPPDANQLVGWERELSESVIDRRRYEVSRQLRTRATAVSPAQPCIFGLTFGKSTRGNRFVGAFWRRW